MSNDNNNDINDSGCNSSATPLLTRAEQPNDGDEASAALLAAAVGCGALLALLVFAVTAGPGVESTTSGIGVRIALGIGAGAALAWQVARDFTAAPGEERRL